MGMMSKLLPSSVVTKFTCRSLLSFYSYNQHGLYSCSLFDAPIIGAYHPLLAPGSHVPQPMVLQLLASQWTYLEGYILNAVFAMS
jgi:hypothetical protein